MRNITRGYILWIISTITLLGVPIVAAQSPAEPAAAPIPAQILTAQKVFISNAQADFIEAAIAPNLAYDELYAAMRSWGKYELTTTPASADLVFQIGFAGGQIGFPLHLTIIDPKTHVTLWLLTEYVHTWTLGSTGRKNFDKAMADIVADLKQLTSQRGPAAPAGDK